MPNRIIKDTICESKGLSETSFFAEDLFKRLITYADDYGRFNADFQIILARLYPRELDIVKIEDIENAMIELCGVGKIAFYTDKARHSLYGCFPRWGDHQRIRDSKKKMPEPDDTSLNDWYFQRFVPISMKQKILIRDKFTCQECGIKIYVSDETIDPEISAKRLIKMATGTFHFDHIVPVCQGGRATLENLRLLCPKCNRTRKKKYTLEEILSFTLQKEENGGESQENIKSECDARQLAATCGNSRLNPIQSNTNPIQSESNEKAQPSDNENDLSRVMNFYFDRVNPTPSPMSIDELKHYTASLGADVVLHALSIALDERKTGWSYIRGILSRYERDGLKNMNAVLDAEQRHREEKDGQNKRATGNKDNGEEKHYNIHYDVSG